MKIEICTYVVARLKEAFQTSVRWEQHGLNIKYVTVLEKKQTVSIRTLLWVWLFIDIFQKVEDHFQIKQHNFKRNAFSILRIYLYPI